uniref:Uncharacterized protein n=1 Tax=Anguilla anguilla TaxID=7936 RepID=A0A0E9STW1_ANGAN
MHVFCPYLWNTTFYYQSKNSRQKVFAAV